MAQKFHFAILRIEVIRASRGLSAIAELLVTIAAENRGVIRVDCFVMKSNFSSQNKSDSVHKNFQAISIRALIALRQ